MRYRTLLALLAAAALGLAAAGTASATTIRLSPAGSFSSATLGNFTFTGGAITVRCNLTLIGRLASSATATAGNTIGTVNGVMVSACAGGDVTAIRGLPGTLAFLRLTATGLEFEYRTIEFTYSVVIFGMLFECAYAGSIPALVEISSGRTGLIRLLPNALTRSGGSVSCPGTGSMTGTLNLSPQQTVTLS
jgi:subtilisin family serine protease